MIIRGNTVGTTMPRTNWAQNDPNKADYLKGRDELAQLIQNAMKSGNDAQTAADNAQATADNALPKSGGTMTGAVDMGGNKITNLAAPTANGDAANRLFVEDTVAAAADNVKAVYKIKTYTDPTQFGCTNVSTLNEVYSALPDGSIFIYNATALTDVSWNFPQQSATLVISKASNPRGIIQLFAAYSAKVYAMHIVSASGNVSPSGVWTEITEQRTKVDLLWENASPGSTFANQKISIALSGYVAVLVYLRFDNTASFYSYGILPVSGGAAFLSSAGNGVTYRKCTPSTSGLTFGTGVKSSNEDNKYCIPVAIYGIK